MLQSSVFSCSSPGYRSSSCTASVLMGLWLNDLICLSVSVWLLSCGILVIGSDYFSGIPSTSISPILTSTSALTYACGLWSPANWREFFVGERYSLFLPSPYGPSAQGPFYVGNDSLSTAIVYAASIPCFSILISQILIWSCYCVSWFCEAFKI